jgi:two-component system OmpR family response regulator
LTHRNGDGYLGAGPARLDLFRHRIVLRDRTVPLPTREFLLLEYLMQKSGEVCTRKELMTAVWGYDFESDTNVVDVYVSRLRSKIPGRLIETVRHVGYCFVGG